MDLRKYWSPQWLYKSNVSLAGYEQEDLPSSYFRNTLPYPLELHWMAITGRAALDDDGSSFSLDAGIARTIRANLSLSSEGDINYIRTLAATLMAPTHAYRFHQARYAVGHALKLPRYAKIPADSGLEVSVRHPGLNPVWAYPNINYASALFNGFTLPVGVEGPRNPHHLACVGPANLQPQAVHNFDCADLQNDGKLDLHLVEIILNDIKSSDDGTYGVAATDIEWLFNPITGLPWMPEGEHMPVGNICPFNDPQYALTGAIRFGGTGAWVYEFPPHTFLYPRQRMGIELRNISGVNQALNISLFGYLEVS